MEKSIDSKIDDLAAMVARGFAETATKADFRELQGRIDGLDTRVDSLDAKMDGLGNRMDSLDNRMDGLDSRMHSVERRLGHVEEGVEEIKEVLTDTARAVDADAETLIGHGKRITKLEARIA